jgi:hypothetical protein
MDAPIYRLDRQAQPEPHILPRAERVSLEITRGQARVRVRPIASRVFLIGAANDCDLVLGDLQFPEAYAYVFVDGTDVSIRRLGAGPPLLVCGEEVETAELFHGDLLSLGRFEMRGVIDHPPRRSRFDEDSTPDQESAALWYDGDNRADDLRSVLGSLRQALAEAGAAYRPPPSPTLEPGIAFARRTPVPLPARA